MSDIPQTRATETSLLISQSDDDSLDSGDNDPLADLSNDA